MILRIAICDDEYSQSEILCGYVNALSLKHPDFHIQHDVYRHGNDLITYYERSEKPDYYDIILLDVEMGNSNGIEAALKIRRFDKKALIIYITNHIQYIHSAAYTNMFRYLIKPIPQKDFDAVF